MKNPTFFGGLLLFLLLGSCTDVVKEYEKVKKERITTRQLVTGKPFVYSGDSLRNIALPVGGIGTGNCLIGGRGNILEWEIFGRADLDELPPYMTFFAIHTETKNGDIDNRILEGELPEFQPNPFGVPRQQLSGIPRFSDCQFESDFPFTEIKLRDGKIPVEASMHCWNPFIPLETELSSIPVSAFEWEIANTTMDSIRAAVSFSFGNPFADYLDEKKISGVVTTIKNENYSGVKFTLKNPYSAEFMIVCKQKDVIVTNQWYRGGWWDNAEVFWKEFSKKGFTGQQTDSYSFESNRQIDVATLTLPLKMSPGDKDTVSFYAFWRIPPRTAENSMALGSGQTPGLTYQNYYTINFADVEEIADYYFNHYSNLFKKTDDFRDLMFASSFPDEVRDALTSNLAALKSNLLMRDEKGRVHAFEGLGNDFGCCPGNCTHVWNYAQTLAFLFPDLERDMRETNFLHDTHPDGAMSFRTVFPQGPYWMRAEAADGQMGTIIRAYREWKFSGDTEWLRKIWPAVKRALEYAWKKEGKEEGYIPWDPEKEGILRGNQHNTYDINFFGPNMLTGSLYLGALKAAGEMAAELEEKQSSNEYMHLYSKGKEKYQELLWKGDYFIQQVQVYPGIKLPSIYKLSNPGNDHVIPKYQYENGCLSDQLLGQFLAHVAGLGYLMDTSKVIRALQSIHRYNFVRDFSEFENVQRVYALNNESGLVLCSWPEDDKPLVPFVYADEVWTGVEYQVASSLIYGGLVDEGIEIVKAVRNRYQGYNRNPFAEVESGRYYARSLASWALLTAISGFQYDGIDHKLAFSPQLSEDSFLSFWSTGNAWGSFSIEKKAVYLNVYHGTLKLREFQFSHFDSAGILEVSIPSAEFSTENNWNHLVFSQLIEIEEGQELVISMK